MPKDWHFGCHANRKAAWGRPAARPRAACWRAEPTSRVSMAGVLLTVQVLLVLVQVLPPVLLTMLLPVLLLLAPALLVLVVLSPQQSWGRPPRRAAHRSEAAELSLA